MGRFRNVSGEGFVVALRGGGRRWVDDGAYHEVSDEEDDGYTSTNWEPAPPRGTTHKTKAATKKAAAKAEATKAAIDETEDEPHEIEEY